MIFAFGPFVLGIGALMVDIWCLIVFGNDPGFMNMLVERARGQ